VVRPEKVENILENLRGYVGKLNHLAALKREEFLSDFTKVESAKHLFQVSVESCIDVANHIIASERFPAPKSYAEAFEILSGQGIIAKEFFPTFAKWCNSAIDWFIYIGRLTPRLYTISYRKI